MNRRQFLKSSVLSGVGLGLTSRLIGLVSAQTPTEEPEELTGNFRPVHDPCIIKEGDTYYLFCTSPRLQWRTSQDLVEWELRGDILDGIPAWAHEAIPASDAIWAPDIAYFNEKFHLYYAVSSFGSNRSVIGLMTTPTLDPESEDYSWTDHGLVVASHRTDDYNAIDPNLVIDQDGLAWLAFGSFWSGIKMRRIDVATGLLSDEDTEFYSLAQRPAPDALEAPFIIWREGYYYLFASYDFCCRAEASTYHVKVGRSETITGPYLDRDGVSLLEDGGTQITFPTERWRGPGHNAILQEGDDYFIVYHVYDANYNGLPTLRIRMLQWDEDGWVSVGES